MQKNYHPCHNHRWNIFVGVYCWYYRWNISVGNLQRVLKYLPPMPQSPMASPSVIYRLKYRRNTSISKVLARIFFWCTFPVGKTVSVWFFISDRISDEQGNYRRSKFQQTNFVGEAVSKNFTDELCGLHRRNDSVSKTI